MKTAQKAVLLFLAATIVSVAQTNSFLSSIVPSAGLVSAPGSPYVIGPYNYSLASGDFNNDGLADLVFVSGGDNSVLTVLLATRDGRFVPAVGSPIPVGADYSIVAVADFNRDGAIDIVTLSPLAITILLGDGTGRFRPIPSAPMNAVGLDIVQANAVAAGDFNHDNKPDLAVVNDGHAVVLLGDGEGGFTLAPGSPVSTQHAATQLVLADLNMDGNLDLAIVDGLRSEMIAYLGDGTGRLQPDPKGPFGTSTAPISIAYGDFNSDGKVDLAIGGYSLTILLGDGTGDFTREPDIIADGLVPRSLAVADLDGDGKLDLVVADADGSTSNVIALLGDGKGGFKVAASGPLSVPGAPIGVAVADFNGDGRLDVATTNGDAGTGSVLLGAASATSSLALQASDTPTVGQPFSVTVAANTSGYRTPTGSFELRDGSAVTGTASLIDGAAAFETTTGTAGIHSFTATYVGDASNTGSTSLPLTVNVAKGSQTISFPMLPRHAYGDPPFGVAASSSSGLPVTINVISGPATLAGNVLTLTGTGVVTLQASQTGNTNYLPAPDVQQQLDITAPSLQIDSVLNAASYAAEPLAPSSFAVLFGVDLASNLGDSSIQISDASGQVSTAMIYFASPAQINFILPAGLNPGMGSLTLQTQAGPSAAVPISITAVDPGLFSADATGTGAAAGAALRVSADGAQTQIPISSCTAQPLVCTAIPIDLGSDTDTVYLSFIRDRHPRTEHSFVRHGDNRRNSGSSPLRWASASVSRTGPSKPSNQPHPARAR